MAAAPPWMKFYPQDWRADEALRLCSLAARGLWVEMLALMHRSERYGQLLISGRVPTDAQLAVQVGASPSEVTALLAELDGAGVFSRAASGAIYSRRMTRDHKKAETARKNGREGGNPALLASSGKQRVKKSSVKGSDNHPDKGGVKAQKPEAINQKNPPTPQGGDVVQPDGVSDGVWRDFIAMRKRQRADLTETALNAILREAKTAGWPIDAALSECVTRGWRGFKADWVAGKPAAAGASPAQQGVSTDAFIRRMERFEAEKRQAGDEAA